MLRWIGAGRILDLPARLLLLAAVALLLSACATFPRDRTAGQMELLELRRAHREARQDTAELRVLIYNVEGLPWPARTGRRKQIRKIGAKLARLRAEASAPHVVMFQEAFVPAAWRIADTAGYPYRVRGPSAHEPGPSNDTRLYREHRAGNSIRRGESLGKLLPSGLYILSDHPISEFRRRAFSPHSCAGFDCLANKGVLLARIYLPELDISVDLMTTHMNAKSASGAPLARHLTAHRLQTEESAAFLNEHRSEANPLVLGGDFNMKGSESRLEFFETEKPYQIVRRFCVVPANACDVRMSWDGDAPWLDTQDLQLFADGAAASIRPIRVGAMFDEPVDGRRLADHDGYLVTYRIVRIP